MNWQLVDSRLRRLWISYSDAGQIGILYRDHVLRPLRDRLHEGERTLELYSELVDVMEGVF